MFSAIVLWQWSALIKIFGLICHIPKIWALDARNVSLQWLDEAVITTLRNNADTMKTFALWRQSRSSCSFNILIASAWACQPDWFWSHYPFNVHYKAERTKAFKDDNENPQWFLQKLLMFSVTLVCFNSNRYSESDQRKQSYSTHYQTYPIQKPHLKTKVVFSA